MIDLMAYPYLSVSLALCGVAAVLVLASREHRRLLLTSGALAAPLALFSWQFIPEYWNPRVLGRFVTTVEDVLFSVSVGVIVMALALAPFRRRVRADLNPVVLVRRYALCLALVVGLHTLLLYSVFGSSRVMYSAMVAVGVFALCLPGVRRETIPVAAVGLMVFPAFYFVLMKLYFAVFPASVGYWVPIAQLPFDVGGVPAFELVWAAAWGATWPPLMWFVVDVKTNHPVPGRSGAADVQRPIAGIPGSR
jgi:hypothetical protein